MICCKKCGYIGNSESEIHLHHLVPLSLEGTDRDGRVYLCKKCHDIIHNMIPKWMFGFIYPLKRDECKAHIKKMTELYIMRK